MEITEGGTRRNPRVIHDLEVKGEELLVLADWVTLVDPVLDGEWEAYRGLVTGYDRDNLPYVGTRVVGGVIRRYWGKGAIVGYATMERGTRIEDIGSDGIICHPQGRVHLEHVSIGRIGFDPASSKAWADRTGALIHGDGVQLVGGVYYTIRGLEVDAVHGQLVDGATGANRRRACNSCVQVAAEFGDVDRVSIGGGRLNGGTYTLRLEDKEDEEGVLRTIRNLAVRNVEFGAYFYGPLLDRTAALDAEAIAAHNDLSRATRVGLEAETAAPAPPPVEVAAT